jgi:hypothetical protein
VLPGEPSLHCTRAHGLEITRLNREHPVRAPRCRQNTEEEAMPDARYFIVQHDDRWTIKFNDEEYGPYKTKDEAMLFAIDAAQKLGEFGDNAEVVLMGEDGHFHTEWSYGREAVPSPSSPGKAA